MSQLTEQQKKEHARRIIREVIGDAEYHWVYEDVELEDQSEAVWEDIHELIQSAKVEVNW